MKKPSEDQASVYKAEPYRSRAMGSLGNASCMLLRQFNFPDTCSISLDKILTGDSDRLNRVQEYLKEHIGQTKQISEFWFRNSDDEAIMELLIDLLEADTKVAWTGYRVMGSVGVNGHDIWTFQLFAKHPQSDTVVYTGDVAPNVLPGRRW